MNSAVDRLVDMARQRWLDDDHEEALQLFREAMKSAPHDLRLAVESASYLGMRFEVSEAQEILQHCEKSLADNTSGLYQVGLAYDRAYLPDHSIRCFRAITRRDSQHSLAWIKIAEWFDRRGMPDEAIDAVEQASQSLPDVKLMRARLLSRKRRYDDAQTVLDTLTSASEIGVHTRVAAWYELARIHDRAGQPEIAYQSATNAKQLQFREAQPHLQRAQELAKLESSFISSVTQDHFQRWSTDSIHATVGLLTGSPRSGTTLLARALGNHPSIQLADEINAYATFAHKEMLRGVRSSNAGDALDGIPQTHLAKCQSRYLKWMESAIGYKRGNDLLLDKNPSTTCLIPAFRRLFPCAAILMAIRDPRDVIVSCYLQHFPLNPVSAMFTRWDLTVARCRVEFEAWLRLRNELTEPLAEIRYEDVVRGDREPLGSVLKSMKLEEHDDLLDFQDGLRTDAVRSPTFAQLFEPIHTKSIGRWHRYETQLAPYISQLKPLCQALGYD